MTTSTPIIPAEGVRDQEVYLYHASTGLLDLRLVQPKRPLDRCA